MSEPHPPPEYNDSCSRSLAGQRAESPGVPSQPPCTCTHLIDQLSPRRGMGMCSSSPSSATSARRPEATCSHQHLGGPGTADPSSLLGHGPPLSRAISPRGGRHPSLHQGHVRPLECVPAGFRGIRRQVQALRLEWERSGSRELSRPKALRRPQAGWSSLTCNDSVNGGGLVPPPTTPWTDSQLFTITHTIPCARGGEEAGKN